MDGYDEDYEKGKAAGIKMVRRMSMARLQRKYSQDPVSKQHLLLYTFLYLNSYRVGQKKNSCQFIFKPYEVKLVTYLIAEAAREGAKLSADTLKLSKN